MQRFTENTNLMTNTPIASEKFDSAIDAVRIIAFLLVFFAHITDPIVNRAINDQGSFSSYLIRTVSSFGRQGVTIFFTLTGFLLARILIREYQHASGIRIRNFYLRRIFRIWPLYFTYITVAIILGSFTHNSRISLLEIPFLLTFTYNLGQIYLLLPNSLVAITWSLSVEEQIYLVFPWFMKLFGHKYFRAFLLLIASLGLTSRILFTYSNFNFVPNTFFYFDAIVIGTFFAIFEGKLRAWTMIRFKLKLVFAIVLITYYICSYVLLMSSRLGQVINVDLTAIASTALLIILHQLKVIDRFKLIPGLAFFGRRSYGMYLFHWMVLQAMFGLHFLFSDQEGFSILGILVALLMTVFVSLISYRFLEKPFLDLRRSYQVV